MRRAKVGDLYCMKVPNGYKLYQWAYHIPKFGQYIRVFPGLYHEIPSDVEEIAASKHSYIVGFAAGKAYRLGLSEHLGNYPVPEQYPFPEYMLRASCYNDDHQVDVIYIREISTGNEDKYCVSSINELPEPYRDADMLNAHFTPDWLMYLFDTNFDLDHLGWFAPGTAIKKYTDLWKNMENEAKSTVQNLKDKSRGKESRCND